MNLRALAGVNSYGLVVREERFFCAVLFHLLLTDEATLRRLLEKAGVPKYENYTCDSVRVFVEYAMARDLWNSLDDDGKANEKKKKFILDCLGNPPGLENLETEEFNEKLVAGSKISKDKIQSPARWGEEKIKVFFKDQKFIENACKLKWAFNVKPDIVIELDQDSVVCIEAKVESSEDVYSIQSQTPYEGWDQKKTDPAVYVYKQNQCQMQEHLMKEVLGFENLNRVFLSLKNPKDTNSHPQDMGNASNDNGKLHYVEWRELLNRGETTIPTVTGAVESLYGMKRKKGMTENLECGRD